MCVCVSHPHRGRCPVLFHVLAHSLYHQLPCVTGKGMLAAFPRV